MHTAPVLTVPVLASICLHRSGDGKLYTHADLSVKGQSENPYVGVRERQPCKGHAKFKNPWEASFERTEHNSRKESKQKRKVTHLGSFSTREEARAARERHVISLGTTPHKLVDCTWPENVQAVGIKWATHSRPHSGPTVAVCNRPTVSAAVNKTLRVLGPSQGKTTCPGLAEIFGETEEPPAKKPCPAASMPMVGLPQDDVKKLLHWWYKFCKAPIEVFYYAHPMLTAKFPWLRPLPAQGTLDACCICA